MAEEFDLIADIREDQGKGASRRLRHEGKVPAIIYGAGRPPRALVFDHNKVLRQLENESFYSSVLNIKVGDKSQAAILKDVQRHPAKNQVMHMDFQRIVEDEEIRMNVPLHFIGEDVAPGVKQDGGNVWRLASDTTAVSDLPAAARLEQNVPNPFNPRTVISFLVPAGGASVRLDVYDLRGRHVRNLVDGVRAEGRNLVEWDGADRRGRAAAAGTYLYQLRAPGVVETRKMMLAR